MKLNIFLLEWRHFIRSPFKIIALILFVMASVYGLRNGANLYSTHSKSIEAIEKKVTDERNVHLSAYDEGELVMEDRPWVDLGTPYWALVYSWIYHFKKPSSAMVYSIGQSEQYGFYKEVDFWSSPYDADMIEEIANPERLQIGTLDFSFALIFLLPLVLLILLHDLKSSETEKGFMPLIRVQSTSIVSWIVSRIAFYTVITAAIIIGLLVYGALLTGVFDQNSSAFWQMLTYSFVYLIFWSILYFFVIKKSNSIMGSTLIMTGLYLLLSFVIPGAIHEYVSIVQPANLMTDLIDANQEKTDEIYNLPNSEFEKQLFALFPNIENSLAYQDSTKKLDALDSSYLVLINEAKKASVEDIKKENELKNKLISNSYFFNPVSFFQNKINSIAGTHFDDYKQYRQEIQTLVDNQIQTMVLDTWQDKSVDKKTYLDYYNSLTK